MCGIACLASPSSGKNCLKALQKLEYRGYDSAGMAGIEDDKIVVYKQVGAVENIASWAENCTSQLVISHTRWATHGKPTKENAHPHLSADCSLAVVHNGIIENHDKLKSELINSGIAFSSQTDTEVIANLIASKSGSPLEKLKAATKELEGSFALGVLFKENLILATRKHSPLYLAKTDVGNMIASDVVCFLGKAKEFYALKEGEFAAITKDKIELFDSALNPIEISFCELEKDESSISLNGYKYYMEKEINEIPDIVRAVLCRYKDNSQLLKAKQLFKSSSEIALIGCGTAYHAAMFGAKVLGEALKIPAHAYIASELKYSKTCFKDTLAIFVSQSGETADTLGCVDLFKNTNQKTIALTNVEHSTLARQCDCVLPVCASVELAVASTKAYVAQILVLYILSRALASQDFDIFSLSFLPDACARMLNDYTAIADLVEPAQKVFFIGRQLDYITSLEAALKLKEITYKSAEGYAAGELKHGTLALVDKTTPVIVFATDEELYKKTLANASEVASRGGKIIWVSPFPPPNDEFEHIITLPKLKNTAEYSLVSIIPFQLLAFLVCTRLGYNPDKPRNLAKSVTVE